MKLPKEHTSSWTPKDGYVECYGEDFYNEIDDDTFHIGQSYMDTNVNKYVCKTCNGDKFYFGQKEYFSAIKCVTCGWETCVHEG